MVRILFDSLRLLSLNMEFVGQITLIPPENAGRMRKTKKKKPRGIREELSGDDALALTVPRPTVDRLRPTSPSSLGSEADTGHIEIAGVVVNNGVFCPLHLLQRL